MLFCPQFSAEYGSKGLNRFCTGITTQFNNFKNEIKIDFLRVRLGFFRFTHFPFILTEKTDAVKAFSPMRLAALLSAKTYLKVDTFWCWRVHVKIGVWNVR